MISVIVPVYNTEKYLEKCVYSIMKQTYQDLEIILVDDGSTDTSGVICDRLAKMDKRIKVVHGDNQGQSNARNIGLKISNGKYVAFVDSDDTISREMLELLVNIIETTSCDISICGHKIVYSDAEIIREEKKYSTEILSEEALWEEIFGKLNNAVWNKLYKKEFLSDIYFSTEFAQGEDLIFNLEYLLKCKKGALNKQPCYNYFKHANSVTSSAFSERKFMEVTSKDRALEFVKKHRLTQVSNAEKFCFRARMNVMRSIIKAGLEVNYKEVIEEYRKYVEQHYHKVKHELRVIEKVEFYLKKYVFVLYKLLIRNFGKILRGKK